MTVSPTVCLAGLPALLARGRPEQLGRVVAVADALGRQQFDLKRTQPEVIRAILRSDRTLHHNPRWSGSYFWTTALV